MSGRLSLNVVVGIAVAGLAAAVLPVAPAWAQAPVDTLIQRPQQVRPKVPLRRSIPEQVTVDDPEVAAQTQQQPADQPNEDGEPQEEGATVERSLNPTGGDAGRDTIRDPQLPADGTSEEGAQGPVVVDGLGDLNRDHRRPEAIAAFDGGVAGYDAIAFQIEQLDPLSDRRIERLFRFEPYDPRGVRIGSFVVFPEVEMGALFNSNVFRSARSISDYAYELRPTVRAVSDWRNHALEVRATSRLSFYDRYATEDDRMWTAEARGRLDITRRTNIEAAVAHIADKDVRSLIDSPTNARTRGDITTDRVAATLNQQFGRATLQLRGSLSDVNYASVAATDGSIISNADRNFTQSDAVVRGSYALNRNAAAFAEFAFRERDYGVASGDGMLRSSTSERYRMGLVFSPLGPWLRGEISAGWGQQTPKDGRLATIQGYLLDASLALKASAITTFLLTLRSEFYDTTAVNSPGTLAREIGLEARHALHRNLIASAAMRYAVSPYQSLDLEDRLITTEVGLDYYLNKNWSVYGRYQHLDFASTDSSRNYLDDIFRVGVRWRE